MIEIRNVKEMISFIIPAHNAAAYLKRAIESIESDANACGGQKKIEIIIVENGSTDDTYSLSEDMALLYSNITVVRSQKGVSAATMSVPPVLPP